MSENIFPNLMSWLARGGTPVAGSELNAIKAALGRLGVNQRGWRLLLSFGETLFAPLEGPLIDHRRPLASLENLCFYLKLLQQCEMDVLPPPAFARAWGTMVYPQGPGHHLMDVPVGLFRAAWLECVRLQYLGKGESAFLATELPQVVFWFFRTEQHRTLTPNQLKRSWIWFRSRQAGWLERCRHRFDEVREWAPLLGKGWVVRGTLAVELTSADAISEEGRIMRHCVETCIDACRAGIYRVFSLREPDTGERLATLGVAKDQDDEDWVIEDCRLEDNEEPDDYLMDVASDVADLCTEAAASPYLRHGSNPRGRDAAVLDLFSESSEKVRS